MDDDESVATEWDEVLANATEEELVDLAGKSPSIYIPLFHFHGAAGTYFRSMSWGLPYMSLVLMELYRKLILLCTI